MIPAPNDDLSGTVQAKRLRARQLRDALETHDVLILTSAVARFPELDNVATAITQQVPGCRKLPHPDGTLLRVR